jgi:hypothetical protein
MVVRAGRARSRCRRWQRLLKTGDALAKDVQILAQRQDLGSQPVSVHHGSDLPFCELPVTDAARPRGRTSIAPPAVIVLGAFCARSWHRTEAAHRVITLAPRPRPLSVLRLGQELVRDGVRQAR